MPPSPPGTGARTSAKPLRVGDRVRCLCRDPWLAGQVCVVWGLRVRSCDGRVGIAVKFSDRCYSVVGRDEVEPA